jgi:energy-coupling factor transporter ATP-binding protein EcfA2
MHLRRIQVPDFRVLKDVDLIFEKEFIPRVFPLGSQNGGGKSTLLQLIFVLLHCSTNPDRFPAIKNILNGFKIHNDTGKRVLAIIEIWDTNRSIELEFFACKDSYINQLFKLDNGSGEQESNIFSFSTINKSENLKKRISRFAGERLEIEDIINELENIINLSDEAERYFKFDRITYRLDKLGIRRRERTIREKNSIMEIQKDVTEQLESLHNKYRKLQIESVRLSRKAEKITEYLKSENLVYIGNYSSEGEKDEDEAILCQVKNLNTEETKPFLDYLSNKVFLAAPSTQVFLFLSQENRKLLFKEQDKLLSSETYYSRLKRANSMLPGLFTYDFLAVDLLIDSFKAARDRDFKEAIETGEYGNSYKILLNDINSMLTNKQVYLKSDLSGVAFKMDKNDETIELYPEDLSHGELKRLSIYMWLKYRNIDNSLVLMDEIEIALHPDWQYRIVSDLTQWAVNNQYILATHSYELCQALTPTHVKELEPTLLKQL